MYIPELHFQNTTEHFSLHLKHLYTSLHTPERPNKKRTENDENITYRVGINITYRVRGTLNSRRIQRFPKNHSNFFAGVLFELWAIQTYLQALHAHVLLPSLM